MPTLRIAILQPPAPDYGRAQAAWSELLARIDDAAQDEPDLVVLPEASYPAWFLGAAATSAPDLADARILGDLAERARQHHLYIAAGLVLGRPASPQNAAVLLSPDGVELARAAESRPAPWFSAGRGPAAASIEGAPIALFAGADHLDPRWVEAIADARTQLCIATGAARGWVGSGQAPGQPPAVAGDPSTHVIATRSAETGAWFAAAGRAGVEADSVGYAGGAGIVSPRDGWVVRAPEDRAGVVLHACELTPPTPGVTPLDFALHTNYPNPFNPETTIEFDVARAGKVKLAVYNLLGQQIKILSDGQLNPGSYRVTWDGTNDSGAAVSSGIYFLRMSAGSFAQHRRMLLMK